MYTDEIGAQFSDDKKTLIKCGHNGNYIYIVPEGVTTIAADAFENCGAESIAFPEGVKSIQWFSGGAYLKELFLPSSLTEFEVKYHEDYHMVERAVSKRVYIYVPKGHKERMMAQLEDLRDFTVIELTPAEMIKYPLALYKYSQKWNDEDDPKKCKRIAKRINARRDALVRRALLPEWKAYVEKVRTAIGNGVRHLKVVTSTVDMGVLTSEYECETTIYDVSNGVLHTILELLEAKKTPLSIHDFGLMRDDVVKALKNHGFGDELFRLHAYIYCYNLREQLKTWTENQYRNVWCDPKPYFYADVKDGLYHPFPNKIGHDGEINFEACKNDYLDWLRRHSEDPFFIADRRRINLLKLSESISDWLGQIISMHWSCNYIIRPQLDPLPSDLEPVHSSKVVSEHEVSDSSEDNLWEDYDPSEDMTEVNPTN